jgi:hypothetical protein
MNNQELLSPQCGNEEQIPLPHHSYLSLNHPLLNRDKVVYTSFFNLNGRSVGGMLVAGALQEWEVPHNRSSE